MQRSGQAADREDIKRQAGSKQRHRDTRTHAHTHLGKRSEMSDGAKQDFAVFAWKCAA